jgi:hypothetical protein
MRIALLLIGRLVPRRPRYPTSAERHGGETTRLLAIVPGPAPAARSAHLALADAR